MAAPAATALLNKLLTEAKAVVFKNCDRSVCFRRSNKLVVFSKQEQKAENGRT